MRRHFLRCIAGVISESSLQNVVCLVSRIFPLAPLHSAFELKPYPAHRCGGKAHLVAVQLSTSEELIDKGSLVVFPIPISRDESRHSALVFHRDLDELSIFQEAVHPRIFVAGLRVTRRGT